MSDTFVGLPNDMAALGAGSLATSELLTAEVDDEYDALNDETFGSTMGGDWEEGHEHLALLGGEERRPAYEPSEADGEGGMETGDIEHTISRLVLEDDLDDPAIMGVSKTRPIFAYKGAEGLFRSSSPPHSSVIESNNIGSPATTSIWTSKREEDHLARYRMDGSPPGRDIASEDPCVISAAERPGPPGFPPRPSILGGSDRAAARVAPPAPPGARLLEDIERSVLRGAPDKGTVSAPRPIPVAGNLVSAFGSLASPPLSPPMMSLAVPMGPRNLQNLRNAYVNRFIPPQLTPMGGTPFQNRYGANRGLVFGRMGYVPHVQPGVNGPARMARYPPPPSMPLPFGEPMGPGIFPSPPHLAYQNRHWGGNEGFRPFAQEPYHVRPNWDEYSNLMTDREKQWLVKIQLMQLQSDHPYLHDYYYTTFTLRKRMKAAKDGERSEEPALLLPERSKVEARTYEPAHFAGSLGKLQATSVYNPRKMIDVGTVHQEDGDSEQARLANREARRLRQCLMDIEKLYSAFLETDDIEKKAAALPADSRAGLYETRTSLVRTIVDGFSRRDSESFVQMVAIRKGRDLLGRILPLVSTDQFVNVARCALGNLRAIAKRDINGQVLRQVLNSLSGPVRRCDMRHLVELGKAFLGTGVEPETVALESGSALEFLLRVFQRAEELYADGDGDPNAEWSEVMSRSVEGIRSLCPPPSRTEAHLRSLVPHLDFFIKDSLRLDELKVQLGRP